MLHTQQNVSEGMVFVQGSPGYEKMLSLGSAYIAAKVNNALQGTANLSVKSMDGVNKLSVDQVLLLSLIHGLMRKDTAACFIFTEIAQKLDSIKTPYLKDWLKEEYFFNYDDVRKALKFAAELTKSGLVIPDFLLALLDSLYSIYCSQKRDSVIDADQISDASILSIDTEKEETHIYNEIDETPEKEEVPPKLPDRKPKENEAPPIKPRPRRLEDPTTAKNIPMVLPNRVLGEYSHCEQFALHRENQLSPKVNSPISPVMKELKTPPINEMLKRLSGEFLFKEIESGNSAKELRTVAETISEVAAEADAMNEKTGDTALHLAVLRRNVDAVKALIKRGAIVDARNKAKLTPMDIAVEREILPIIRALHSAGVNINQKTSKGESLLHLAAASAGLETIELLIDLGADLDNLDMRRQTPLFRAAKKGRVEVMEKLEEEGSDIHVKDTFERTLLHYAAWHGQVDAVSWLLNHGLDINATTKHGWTPLHWAVANGQLSVAYVLLTRGANVNARDSARRTPLFWASEVGNSILVDLLKSFRGTL